jgi:hypothetical protein
MSIILPGKREERFYLSSNVERKAWIDSILQQMDTLDRNRKSLRIIENEAPTIKPLVAREQGIVRITAPKAEDKRKSTSTGRLQRLLEIFNEVIRLEQEVSFFFIVFAYIEDILVPYRVKNADTRLLQNIESKLCYRLPSQDTEVSC